MGHPKKFFVKRPAKALVNMLLFIFCAKGQKG
jgi:hypothetical protein